VEKRAALRWESHRLAIVKDEIVREERDPSALSGLNCLFVFEFIASTSEEEKGMLRVILGGIVILTVTTGCHRASTVTQQNGRGRGLGARGTVESVDPAAGTLTVKVRSRQNPDEVEKTFQVEEDTSITSFSGEAKKEMKGRAGLSDPQFKRGSRVSVSTSEEGSKVTSIQVGDLPRRGRNRGARQPPQ
jgi:hypothetical protein